jgi:hypothetical protein
MVARIFENTHNAAASYNNITTIFKTLIKTFENTPRIDGYNNLMIILKIIATRFENTQSTASS